LYRYSIHKARQRQKRIVKNNYSRINTNTGDINQIMFIGNVEKTSYEFARRKGSKDKKPRSKRSMLGTGAKIAGGLAGAGALAVGGRRLIKAGANNVKTDRMLGAAAGRMGAAKSFAGGVKNRVVGDAIGIGGAAKRAGSASMSIARQGAGTVGRGAENLRAKTARAGYGAADRVGGAIAGARSAVAGGKAELNKRVMRKLPKNQRPQ
jgi:hypothetical protein